MDPPPKGTSSHALYALINSNRRKNEAREAVSAIPLAGVHDALSAKAFAQCGAPALFLSGFGVSASLLGVPGETACIESCVMICYAFTLTISSFSSINLHVHSLMTHEWPLDAGITNQVEMEQITRNIYSSIRNHNSTPPLIVDGDTGYGGPSNMLRTISSLASAGAAAITIEDQQFPKKCTIAAGDTIRIVGREEAVQRVRGALGARDCAGAACWIVARTDCRLAFGFDEVVERCLRFEELGAEIVYAENLQNIDEYQKLRERLDPCTVTMVAQVQETKGVGQVERPTEGKPFLDARQIGELGYDLALFGVTPLQSVIGGESILATVSMVLIYIANKSTGSSLTALLSTADQFYNNHGIISNDTNLPMSDFSTVKRVVGFDDIEEFERQFPCA
jgi:2-methylisocitrate lyase-like PEP mutase family enzyme